MPVVITTILPREASLEAVLRIESQLPTGHPDEFIAHVVTYDESQQQVRMIDIWESEEARDAWFLEHVLPVIRREAAKEGVTNTAPESSDVSEAALLLTRQGSQARS